MKPMVFFSKPGVERMAALRWATRPAMAGDVTDVPELVKGTPEITVGISEPINERSG